METPKPGHTDILSLLSMALAASAEPAAPGCPAPPGTASGGPALAPLDAQPRLF